MPAQVVDTALASNQCYQEGILITAGAARMYHSFYTAAAGKAKPTWKENPRLFYFVKDDTPPGAPVNSSLVYRDFRLRRQDNVKFNNMELFTVMKDQGTCQDPLALTQKSDRYQHYSGGIAAPGGWMMATQKSDVSLINPENEAYYTQADGSMQAFMSVGRFRKAGPGTFIMAMENPGYSFAGNNHAFSYGCGNSTDDFPLRREPFALSLRIEIPVPPNGSSVSEDANWPNSGGKMSLTNHITNRQVVYVGANFTAKMNQAVNTLNDEWSGNIDFRWTRTGCNNNRPEDQNEPVPEGFWSSAT